MTSKPESDATGDGEPTLREGPGTRPATDAPPLRDRDVDRLRAAVGVDTFSGRFEILHETGAGGMGVVYEAIDRETRGRVAIKVITSAADRARFAAEAEVLERLTHPGIVRYVRHGTTTRGEPYLAMEWLVGESLADRLARGRLTIVETVRLGELVADALDHAHREGIVHRDLKPSNIFLVDKSVEHAHVIDFGVAKINDSDLTQTGQLIGTPGYMAPEQVRGDRTVDRRADMFALGCVLYESLTGVQPFAGAEIMEILARLLLEAPQPLDELVEDVPPRLAHLVESMLSKDREHRLGDARIARDELVAIRQALLQKNETALEEIPDHVPRPSEPELASVRRRAASQPTLDDSAPRTRSRRQRRSRWIVPVALGSALLVAGAITVVVMRDDSSRAVPCSIEQSTSCGPRCEAGDGAACRIAAEVLHRGLGVTVDHEAARILDARGCELGHGPACFELGKSLSGVLKVAQLPADDPRTQRRVAEMADALRRGCDRDVLAACRQLGREYSGWGKTYLPYNPQQSFTLVEKACAGLDETACKGLQDMIDDARHPVELRDRAKPVLQDACRRRAMPSCKRID